MFLKLFSMCLPFLVPLAAMADRLPPQASEVVNYIVEEDRYPAHEVTFANGVRSLPCIVYGRPTGYRPLTLDLYLPPTTVERPDKGFPLVVFIHGGAWMRGDSRRSGPFVDFSAVLAALSANGYVVASVNYRLSGEAVFPTPVQDVKAAIRWLRSRASQYGIDPALAIAWGESAGGHLASLTAVSCNAAALDDKDLSTSTVLATRIETSSCIQGSVAWYGVFDLATIADQAREDSAMSRDDRDAPEWRMLGCFGPSCSQAQATASPVSYVDAGDPPMLLIVGTEDKTVPYHQTLEMAEKLTSAAVAHELIVIPEVNHLFIGKTQEQTREANLRALDATFQFIDKATKTYTEECKATGTPKCTRSHQ